MTLGYHAHDASPEGPHPDRPSPHGGHAHLNQVVQKHGHGEKSRHVSGRGLGVPHGTGTNGVHESLGDKIKKAL